MIVTDRVVVPKAVLPGILYLRDVFLASPPGFWMATAFARTHGYVATVIWLSEHYADFERGWSDGFIPEEVLMC